MKSVLANSRLGRFTAQLLTQPMGRNHAIAAIGLITLFWFLFIIGVHAQSYYTVKTVTFFLKASFWDVLKIMDDTEFARFSPLALGPIGYFDMHYLVPWLGMDDEPLARIAIARRLVWLHPIFSAASTAVAALITWRLFQDRRLVGIAILLVGLTDTIPFQMRFVALLGFYGLHICTFLSIFYLMRLEETRNRQLAVPLAVCTFVALCMWEQGLDLVFSLLAALGVAIYMKRSSVLNWRTLPEARVLLFVGVVAVLYLIMRVPSGIEEAMRPHREDTYFLAYKNPLLMFDDLLMNISGLAMQAWRQFLPIPPLSFAVMLHQDMDLLNTYNLTYAQHPNMFYRQMGLWYSGVAFACSLMLIVYSVRLAMRKTGIEQRLIIISLCILLFGIVMHLPIMHRDYFYIPGYALGYKIAISYIGFVMLLLIAAREFFNGRWFNGLTHRRQLQLLWGLGTYYCLAAIVRSGLGQLPNTFPW